ncbi:hypothetical protein ONZ45_g6993 [Pleurotus djamor]|nr:hypothetical protein ONZ45_g6993 [Pleurotus djamor]
MRWLALYFASRALHAVGQYTETHDTLVITSAIDNFVNSILTDWNSPGGVAIAIVKQTGAESWNIETKGYGRAKADNTPLFTAIATGMLVEDDSITPRLTWKTKIASIVPEWQLADPVASDNANLIDLISHRTGLPHHDLGYHATDTLSNHISKYRHLKPSAKFRETYQYNNNMYALLSYLPTVLLPSQPSLASYVKSNIFDPLGMTSTTYSYSVAQTSGNLADGFARQQSPTSPFDAGTTRVLPYWDQDTTLDGDFTGPE